MRRVTQKTWWVLKWRQFITSSLLNWTINSEGNKIRRVKKENRNVKNVKITGKEWQKKEKKKKTKKLIRLRLRPLILYQFYFIKLNLSLIRGLSKKF